MIMDKPKETTVLQISEDGLTVEKCLDKYIESITIPDGVKNIGKEAFYRCDSLKKVVFPNSLEHIGYLAFWGCTNLEKLEFSNTNLFLIGKGAFQECIRLVQVFFPKTISSICESAFVNCINLSDIGTLPKECFDIRDYAFAGCHIKNFSHPELQIENGLAIKGKSVLYNTYTESCRNIEIPENVDTIQKFAFSIDDENGYDIGIHELNIGEGIKVIKPRAFYCESVLLLKLPSSLEKISESAFSDNHIPPVIINKSKIKMNFKNTKIIAQDDNTQYSVRNGQFVIAREKNKISLIYAAKDYNDDVIEIPADVTNIEYDALRDCEDNYITLPDSFVLDNEPECSKEEQECICGENKFLLPPGARINRYFKAEPCEETILEKVKRLVVEHCGICGEKVTESSNFIEDLGCDSFDTVELVMAFEEEFECEILDEDAEKLLTVNDVVKYIESHI